MPRFALLRHETPAGYPRPSHYDFFLEQAGALRTWALERLPERGEAVLAEQLADHRLAYLDFEGEIAGSRGSVVRVDAGDYEVVQETADGLVVMLRGARLRGTVVLDRDREAAQRWSLAFSADGAAG
jgi:hypothetical protein